MKGPTNKNKNIIMDRFINKLSGTSVVNNKKHEGHEEKHGDGKDNNNNMCLSGGL